MTGGAISKAAEVRLEQVGKRFGETWAVRDASLRVARGEFFTFLGPSGCGKTTLLRTIAGFYVPEEGEVYLDDERVTQMPPWKRDVGLVFQNYALWPHMGVFDNVAFGLRERKVPRREMRERVLAVLARVGLEGMERRRPSQLSGGQQQRVALARTLVVEPRVLLLDEPLSNLDAKLRAQMRLELLRLQRDIGITTIYVTHDQEEALALSTRVAVMDRGEVAQMGSPQEIYHQPMTRFVADFVGAANLLKGEILEDRGGRLMVHVGDGIILATPSFPSAPPVGARVLLCIRPEAVRLDAQLDEGEEAVHLHGHVEQAVFEGARVVYTVRVSGELLLRVDVANPKGPTLKVGGQAVTLAIAPSVVTLMTGE